MTRLRMGKCSGFGGVLGHAGDDGQAGPGQLPGEMLRGVDAVRRCPTRADDGQRRTREERDVAAHVQHERGIDDLLEHGRVCFVDERDHVLTQ